MMHSDDEEDRKPPAVIFAARLNYGNLLDECGFDTMVCDLEERGLCQVPPIRFLN